MQELRFDGKVALITGAGRGVGRAHALALASRGCKVVVADPGVAIDGQGSASTAPAEEVVNEIRAAGGEAIACYELVNDEAGAARMVQLAIDTYGRLDILVNNAGISSPELFEVQTTEQFRRLVDVHYLGTVYVTKAAWPHMMQAGYGRIINTCSEGPLGIHEMMTGYGGAKGGVIGLTLALAAEGPKYGIIVNGFSPRIATRLSAPEVLAHVYSRPVEAFQATLSNFPPELASPALVYLAHESCGHNGLMLVSGGGQVLRMAIMQNAGYTTQNITPEKVAENIDQIIDMGAAMNVGVGKGGTAVLPHAETTGGH